jgi:hypothetical protein
VHGLIFVDAGLLDWPSGTTFARWDHTEDPNVSLSTGETRRIRIARIERRPEGFRAGRQCRFVLSYVLDGAASEAASEWFAGYSPWITIRVTIIADPPASGGMWVGTLLLHQD